MSAVEPVQHYTNRISNLASLPKASASISLFPDEAEDHSSARISGIVHDFNNLLAVILTHTSIAMNKLPLDSPARSYLDRAVRTARRTAEMSNQLLMAIKNERMETAPLQLNHLILETVDLVNPRLTKAKLNLQLASDLNLVDANESQLRQVIMNLVLNASDAIQRPPGSISITTHNLTVPETRQVAAHQPPPGEYICLQVEDDGTGMDQETMEQIFLPYFTTKPASTGVGLTATLGIIHAHRGGVQVRSMPGTGTVFRVLLPALNEGDF